MPPIHVVTESIWLMRATCSMDKAILLVFLIQKYILIQSTPTFCPSARSFGSVQAAAYQTRPCT